MAINQLEQVNHLQFRQDLASCVRLEVTVWQVFQLYARLEKFVTKTA
jgi:hypothetical protein